MQGNPKVGLDDLDRLLEILPMERGAQRRVAVERLLPRPAVGFHGDGSIDREAELLHVHCRVQIESLEENGLLHGRQLENVLDRFGLHRWILLRCLTFATSLSRAAWLSFTFEKSEGV